MIAFGLDIKKYASYIKSWYLTNYWDIVELFNLITYNDEYNLLWKNTVLEMFLFEFWKQMNYISMIWDSVDDKNIIMYRVFYNSLVTNIIPTIHDKKVKSEISVPYHKKEYWKLAYIKGHYIFTSFQDLTKRIVLLWKNIEFTSPMQNILNSRGMYYFFTESWKKDLIVWANIYIYREFLQKAIKWSLTLDEFRSFLEILTWKELIVFLEHIVFNKDFDNLTLILDENSEIIFNIALTKLANTIK